MGTSSWKDRIEIDHLEIRKRQIEVEPLQLKLAFDERWSPYSAMKTLFLTLGVQVGLKNVLSEMWLSLRKERFYKCIKKELKSILIS